MSCGAIDQQQKILLHLSLIPDVGPATTINILAGLVRMQQGGTQPSLDEILSKRSGIDLRILYSFTRFDFMEQFQVSQRTAELLALGLADHKNIEQECERLEWHKIKITTLLDDDYPLCLRHIYLPPCVLYYRGQPFYEGKKIALVGSRKASVYAQHVIDMIVPELVMHEWQTVSGGAAGVDSMVHRSTIDVGGKTIVVLGSGLLQPYPEKNIPLFERVIERGGTVLSPFPLMSCPDRGTFPARNRIIAGLSQGSVVVQAAARSGALITARFALEQGRCVFAVPGPIGDILSAGCHALIRQGALLVESARDILTEFGEGLGEGASDLPYDFPKSMERVTKDIEDGGDMRGKVLYALGQPMALEDLMSVAGLSMTAIQDLVFELQLEGKVKQHFNGLWERS